MSDLETVPVGTLERLAQAEAERDALAAKLDTLEELKEEYSNLEMRYHLLANEWVYEGNSVQHWRQKARAYKDCAGAICELKKVTGAESPTGVVEAVQALAAKLQGIIDFCDRPSGGGMNGDPIWDDFKSQAPSTTSLARLKAQWQVEALNQLAAIAAASGESWDADKLRHHAAVMSRQAEKAGRKV